MPESIVIWGAAGHAVVVAEAIRALGTYTLAGFLDDDPARTGQAFFGSSILGTRHDLAALRNQGISRFVMGFSHCRGRESCAELAIAAGLEPVTIVHPSAIVSPTAVLASGVFVNAGAIVNGRATIAAHSIINTGAIVDHDCLIGLCAHLAPRATLAGTVRIGARAWIGLAACVLEGRSIGADSIVGAGAVVHRDLPERITAIGVPARIHRHHT
jgi:UDP-N-acetylbacillosamine N-acetyltransferase